MCNCYWYHLISPSPTFHSFQDSSSFFIVLFSSLNTFYHRRISVVKKFYDWWRRKVFYTRKTKTIKKLKEIRKSFSTKVDKLRKSEKRKFIGLKVKKIRQEVFAILWIIKQFEIKEEIYERRIMSRGILLFRH